MPLVVALLIGAALTLLESWMFMLLVGALHARVDAVPAIGYGTSILAICLISLIAIPFAKGGTR